MVSERTRTSYVMDQPDGFIVRYGLWRREVRTLTIEYARFLAKDLFAATVWAYRRVGTEEWVARVPKGAPL